MNESLVNPAVENVAASAAHSEQSGGSILCGTVSEQLNCSAVTGAGDTNVTAPGDVVSNSHTASELVPAASDYSETSKNDACVAPPGEESEQACDLRKITESDGQVSCEPAGGIQESKSISDECDSVNEIPTSGASVQVNTSGAMEGAETGDVKNASSGEVSSRHNNSTTAPMKVDPSTTADQMATEDAAAEIVSTDQSGVSCFPTTKMGEVATSCKEQDAAAMSCAAPQPDGSAASEKSGDDLDISMTMAEGEAATVTIAMSNEMAVTTTPADGNSALAVTTSNRDAPVTMAMSRDDADVSMVLSGGGAVATEAAPGGVPDEDEDWESMSTSSSEDSEEGQRGRGRTTSMEAAMEEVKEKVKQIMEKPKPKHTWSLIRELHKRQRGTRPSLLQPDKFRLHMYSSLHAVERLELMSLLCAHDGCVNCLHWNRAGDRLASGSDDLKVVVWDWQCQKPAFSYHSGHKSNIFEAKFVPLCADTHIVSTSRDGQVRLAVVSPDGECRSIRLLAQHRGSGRKLALQPDSPHTILSCGEDAVVFSIDLRQDKPQILTTCMDDGKKVPTNSMAAHPEDPNVFLLSCVDKFVRVYDRRMIGAERRSYRRLCPHQLLDSGYRYSVTCAQFNHNGTRIAASYNDEDIYLFDGADSDGAEALHQYSGHRNNATVKGVNFFGPSSQYVVSGSDCGNIFFWDVDTEAIVQCMAGDENGVVNCLEPHPHSPILATSGLDDDVKIWVPSRDDPPDLATLKTTVEKNLRDRLEEQETPVESLSGSLMWTLMHQVLGSHRRRIQMMDQEESDDDHPSDCRTS